ncbi:DNA gyrase inhibitor YacG [Teredinibacter sp. KSP-S5-2]|uniref:DNA gyrase inhibitor YacG n=1 Tax=Teredinibacter sp. KSP-S5-2 TaxID=3034506 RepID=UPI0039778137
MTKEFPHRPFCSDRCKNIDFGDWALENHKIEGPSQGVEGLEEDLWSGELTE